jgi:hypothetical protein
MKESNAVMFTSLEANSTQLKFLAFAGLMGVAVICGVGCKDENPEIEFPTSNVSYSAHVQPLFDRKCTGADCHGAGAHVSALELTSYSKLMDPQLLVVIPGDPDDSKLYLRISGRLTPQMPRNDLPLTDNQQVGIWKWIKEGANNN